LFIDPHSAIENVVGHKITRSTKFIVEDQSDSSTIYINIPRRFGIEDLELTEEELETVSGGITPGFVVAGAICLGVAAVGAVCYGVGYAVGYYTHKK
jgi:lactobin A/cerein 7B family class IIb bacteriocin